MQGAARPNAMGFTQHGCAGLDLSLEDARDSDLKRLDMRIRFRLGLREDQAIKRNVLMTMKHRG